VKGWLVAGVKKRIFGGMNTISAPPVRFKMRLPEMPATFGAPPQVRQDLEFVCPPPPLPTHTLTPIHLPDRFAVNCTSKEAFRFTGKVKVTFEDVPTTSLAPSFNHTQDSNSRTYGIHAFERSAIMRENAVNGT